MTREAQVGTLVHAGLKGESWCLHYTISQEVRNTVRHQTFQMVILLVPEEEMVFYAMVETREDL